VRLAAAIGLDAMATEREGRRLGGLLSLAATSYVPCTEALICRGKGAKGRVARSTEGSTLVSFSRGL
jgi:hypothetical protein